MPKLSEVDPNVSLVKQMSTPTKGPVVLVNSFYVAPADVDAFISAWSADAAIMKRQPGFISAQLHRGITGSSAFLNYAVWESNEAFAAAFRNPEFQASLRNYPDSAVAAPHLFQTVAVRGVCLGQI